MRRSNRIIANIKPNCLFRRLLFVLIFSISNLGYAALPSDTLVVKEGVDVYPIHRYLYYTESLSNSNSPQNIALLPKANFKKLFPKKTLEIGVAKGYYWLVFTLKNDTEDSKVVYFRLNYPTPNRVLYYEKEQADFRFIGKSGVFYPFYERQYINADNVLEITLKPKQVGTFLIAVDKVGEGINLRPELLSAAKQRSYEQYFYLLFGLISGLMITNIIVNLFLFASLKQKSHIYYAGYVLAMLLWILTGASLDYQFIFYNFPRIPIIIEYIVTGFGIIMMSNLIAEFLTLNKRNSSFIKYISINAWIIAALLVLVYPTFIVFDEFPILRVVYMYCYMAVACFSVILFIAAAIQSVLKGNKLAWFYLASCIYLCLAVIEYVLYLFGVKVNDDMMSYPTNIQIGIILETIIIFLGIIFRYNRDRREKVLLQDRIIEAQKTTATKIVEAQEEERKRIARDLHDDVGATASTLLLHISNLPAGISNAYHSHQANSIALSKKIVADLRLISHDLLPKEFAELGIFEVLKAKVTQLDEISAIKFRLVTAGNDKNIPEILAITVYRIINELMNNVIKHAYANYCSIELVESVDQIMLIMEDDGVGITESAYTGGIGMKNIKSRVDFLKGTINIDGNKRGTSIIIEIPILADER